MEWFVQLAGSCSTAGRYTKVVLSIQSDPDELPDVLRTRQCGTIAANKQPLLIDSLIMTAITSLIAKRLIVCSALLATFAAFCTPVQAQRRQAPPVAKEGTPRDFRSRNFLVHTDISAEKAQELLTKLETMLVLISKYWGRPNKQIIECYVVKDLSNWPDGALHPRGVQSISTGGGVTISQVATQGGRVQAKSIVFAGSERGTAQHEAVHAYCAQSFGRTGPVWYSEGMAEMGQYWKQDDPGVNCREEIVRYLQNATRKKAREVVDEPSTTGDSWQNYAWRWALCHMLANNKNYQNRFRPLGLALLGGQDASFNQMYGTVVSEIEFEYDFFIAHMAPGYRVDLCSWDWKAKYRQPRGKSSLVSKIESRGGWQPSRAELKEGTEYAYEASGNWKLSKDGESIDADGNDSGEGRLLGIIYSDYKLSEPFELGAKGTFKAPADGMLLLRCNDNWAALADNVGKVTVKIKNP